DENGVVYATFSSANPMRGTLVALAHGTTPLWSYTTAASDSLHLIGALADAGGAIAIDQQQGLVPFDANGNPGTPSGSPFPMPVQFASSIVSPFALGNWVGPINGALSMFQETAKDPSDTSTTPTLGPKYASSSFPYGRGNLGGQNSSP